MLGLRWRGKDAGVGADDAVGRDEGAVSVANHNP